MRQIHIYKLSEKQTFPIKFTVHLKYEIPFKNKSDKLESTDYVLYGLVISSAWIFIITQHNS